MFIYELRCTECFEEIASSDIYFEPPEPETGHYAYAETRCCGAQEVYILHHKDDPEPERTDILDQRVWEFCNPDF